MRANRTWASPFLSSPCRVAKPPFCPRTRSGRDGSYLSAAERNVAYTYSAQREEMGVGLSRRIYRTVAKEMVQAKGTDLKATAQTESELARADRLLNAKCGNNFVLRNTSPSHIAVVSESLDGGCPGR